MNSIWKALVACFLGMAALVLGTPWQAEAQVPKVGRASFHNPGHWQGIGYKTGEKSTVESLEWSSVLVAKGDAKFLAFAQVTCVSTTHYLDLEKGTIEYLGACRILDADKDAIFVSMPCKFAGWNDWCTGSLIGGTGKYAGVDGSMRWAFPPDLLFHGHQTPAQPHDVKTRYETSGETTLQFDIAWKLP